jgi:hypothetical protein
LRQPIVKEAVHESVYFAKRAEPEISNGFTQML